jgi:DNA repair protein RecO (recombination protein O)
VKIVIPFRNEKFTIPVRDKKYSSKALVIEKKSIGETDRIFVLYSKRYGKLSVIAKGVRKPKSRKRGSLEVFNEIKYSASKGKTLDYMTEVEVVDGFNDIRNDLKRVSVAYFFIEVVNKITRDEEPNSEFYDLVTDYLNALRKSTKTRRLRERYITDTLVVLGFWPRGKTLVEPDRILEEILERKLVSRRVGKKIQS